MSVWCFLALLTLAPVATGTNPGIIIRVTQKALDYVRETLIGNLDEILEKLKVPDIKRESFPHIDCQITPKQIHDLTKSAVKFVPDIGVTLSAEDVFINLRGHFKCAWVDQDYKADLERLTFSITIKVENKNGHPSLTMDQCNLRPGTMTSDIDLVFRMLIKGYIYWFGRRSFCSWLKNSQIPAINNMLATNVLPIEKLNTEIDMLMVKNPVISSNFLDLSVKGVFYSIKKKTEPPFSPPTNFELPKETDKMFYMGLSAFTINSFVFGHHDTGALRFDITDDMIPSGFPFRLSTTTFGAFIPEIAKLFPDQMMKLSVGRGETPIIKFRKGVVEVSSTVTAYVIDSNNNKESPLFELRLEASANVHLDVTEQKLTGTVTLNKIGANVNNNQLKQYGVKNLEAFLNDLLKHFLFPIINAHLQKGYLLPLQLLPLAFTIGTTEPVNIQVQVLDDYLLVGTDVKFTSQP